MKASESRMSLRILRVFRFHVLVLYPVRPDLILPAVLSFRPINEINRPERRLDLRLFRVLLVTHKAPLATPFAGRFDRECPSVLRTIAVDDRVKRERTFRFIGARFVV